MSTTALAPSLTLSFDARRAAGVGLPRQRTLRPRAASTARSTDRSTARSTPAVRVRPRPLKLTRRGRLLITCTAATVLAGVVVVATGAFSGASAGTGAASAHAPARVVHTVLPGQTLSAIAAQWAPTQDWREVADEIVVLNALPSMSLRAGQQLTMPDRG